MQCIQKYPPWTFACRLPLLFGAFALPWPQSCSFRGCPAGLHLRGPTLVSSADGPRPSPAQPGPAWPACTELPPVVALQPFRDCTRSPHHASALYSLSSPPHCFCTITTLFHFSSDRPSTTADPEHSVRIGVHSIISTASSLRPSWIEALTPDGQDDHHGMFRPCLASLPVYPFSRACRCLCERLGIAIQ